MYLKLSRVAIHIQSGQSFAVFDCWVEDTGTDYVIKFLKLEIVVSILRLDK